MADKRKTFKINESTANDFIAMSKSLHKDYSSLLSDLMQGEYTQTIKIDKSNSFSNCEKMLNRIEKGSDNE